MENVNTNNAAEAATTSTVEETTTTTTYGPIGKFFRSNKVRAVLGGAAVVGAAGYGYMRFVATGNPIEAAESTGEAVAALHGMFAA